MSNADRTYTCDYPPCGCEVADDETHLKSDDGRIFCCEGCRSGDGCDHPGCGCGESS